MAAHMVEDSSIGISEMLKNELTKSFPSDADRTPKRVGPALADEVAEPPSRLPRRIAGGFQSVSDDLERRARDWRNMVRLLEQQRPNLEIAEAERDRSLEALARIIPEVQESGRTLKAMIDSAKKGDVSGDLAAQFSKSLRALDELESVAEALTTGLLRLRSAWEPYARSIIHAQKMRDELKGELK